MQGKNNSQISTYVSATYYIILYNSHPPIALHNSLAMNGLWYFSPRSRSNVSRCVVPQDQFDQNAYK
jgi:hypothetical protein